MQTPCYVYDTKLLEATLGAIQAAIRPSDNFHVHYAVKANANARLLKIIANAGLGIDAVSGGEIKTVLEAGFPAQKIVFAGVGKADWEINLALDAGICSFNVESIPELEVIDQLAAAKGKTADVCLRINPDIDAHTHEYITTGLAENKFGIAWEDMESVIRLAQSLAHIRFRGLHFHIGSQILNMEAFELLCQRINAFQDRLKEVGITLEIINVGGGLGIDYDEPMEHPIPDFQTYFEIFRKGLKKQENQEVHFELGRAIVGQCGNLLSQVLYVKESATKRFAIIDAGMTELIRPALYGAHHKIERIGESDAPQMPYDVVGPICESSDVFGENVLLPTLKRGDLIIIRSAGAYGEAMSSNYNCRPHAACYFV